MVLKRAKIRKIVSDFVDRLNNEGIPVKIAYLFGSYAWGKPRLTSDIDIAIVSEKFKTWNDIKRLTKLLDLARHVEPKLPIDIDVVGFTSDEIKKASYFDLAAEIRQKGQIIYKKAA